MNNETISIQLTKSEALVVFEFLARFKEEEQLAIQHPAEQRALWRLYGELERVIVAPSVSDYDELLRQAREDVTGNGK